LVPLLLSSSSSSSSFSHSSSIATTLTVAAATTTSAAAEEEELDIEKDLHELSHAIELIESLHLDKFYINGSWVDSVAIPKMNDDNQDGRKHGDSPLTCSSDSSYSLSPAKHLLNITDPSTAQTVAELQVATAEDVHVAVRSAREAWQSWATMTTPQQRQRYVERFLHLYIENTNELATLVSIEMGSPFLDAKSSHVGSGRYNVKTFLDIHGRLFKYERSLPPVGDDTSGVGGYTTILYESVGVVGLITPWNWPLNQLTLKLIPALLVGCTCVVKPSEEAPLSAALLADLFHQSGFPPGVINFVHGDGKVTGEALSSHPDVDMISFTGSTSAGKSVAENSARHLAKTTLELGGKGAYIVFADLMDEEWVKEVVVNCADNVFYNSGQSCNAPTRLFVERPFYTRAIQWAKEAADQTRVESAHFHPDGDDYDYDGHIGPVVNQRQFERIQQYIQIGIDEGAELIAGGLGRPDHLQDRHGFFVRPTVFAGCTTNMTIMQEEIFGPVLCITPFDTENDVIEMSNDTPYGLTNYVHSRNLTRRRRLARLLRSGMVEMNDAYSDDGSPFGGIKSSGYGREGGMYGLEEFCTIKAISGYHEMEDDLSL
jgi:aldehyde dehydrogenase (NAD+)